MDRGRQRGTRKRPGLALLCGLALVCGCRNLPGGDDPLWGTPRTPGLSPRTAQGVPPIPPPASSTSSPASLATGTPQPLDSRPRTVGASEPSAQEERTPRPENKSPTPGVTLSQPRVAEVSPTARSEPVQRETDDGQVRTVEEGLKYLQGRRVSEVRLQLIQDSGLWRCSCAFPIDPQTRQRRTLLAEARDPLTAVRLLIQKLNTDPPSI